MEKTTFGVNAHIWWETVGIGGETAAPQMSEEREIMKKTTEIENWGVAPFGIYKGDALIGDGGSHD